MLSFKGLPKARLQQKQSVSAQKCICHPEIQAVAMVKHTDWAGAWYYCKHCIKQPIRASLKRKGYKITKLD